MLRCKYISTRGRLATNTIPAPKIANSNELAKSPVPHAAFEIDDTINSIQSIESKARKKQSAANVSLMKLSSEIQSIDFLGLFTLTFMF